MIFKGVCIEVPGFAGPVDYNGQSSRLDSKGLLGLNSAAISNMQCAIPY